MLAILDALRDGPRTNVEILDSFEEDRTTQELTKKVDIAMINRAAAICARLGLLTMTDDEGEQFEATPYYIKMMTTEKIESEEQEVAYLHKLENSLSATGVPTYLFSSQTAKEPKVFHFELTEAGKILVGALSHIHENLHRLYRIAIVSGSSEEKESVRQLYGDLWNGTSGTFKTISDLFHGNSIPDDAYVHQDVWMYRKLGFVNKGYRTNENSGLIDPSSVSLTSEGRRFARALDFALQVAARNPTSERPTTLHWAEAAKHRFLTL